MRTEETGVLFTEDAIRNRVGELAARISADYSHVDELVMVGVLRGCYIFLADLSRRLTVPRRIDFISVAAYGKTKYAGPVRLIMDLRTDIRRKHVLLVEDIVDTGNTLEYLVALMKSRGPASLKTCALLRNPVRMEKELRIDYLGFDIPDVWVVGYGLDFQDRDRALPYIRAVAEECAG